MKTIDYIENGYHKGALGHVSDAAASAGISAYNT